jgi:hypothetical protein
MKAQRRDGAEARAPKYVEIRNAVSSCDYGKSQAAPIKNNVSSPKAEGYKKVKGAVSG